MHALLGDRTRTWRHTAHVTMARGLAWGAIGGLAGTLIMDMVLMGAMLALGMPALTCFSVVGSTVARFLSIPGFEMAGYVPLGVTAHYLIGPLVGAAFGLVMTRVDWLRADGLKRSIVGAVLYVEILSQPLLALTPILLKWTAAETIQWFGASFVMHLILGFVLGLLVGYGLRPANAAQHPLFAFIANRNHWLRGFGRRKLPEIPAPMCEAGRVNEEDLPF